MAIAANAIMVGVVDQLLLQPPPGIADADGLRVVYFGTSPLPAQTRHTYPVVAALRDRVAAFASASARHRARVTIGRGADARQADAELINAAYFTLLGLTPAAGRFFTSAEDRVPEADPVIVLSDDFWSREFHRDDGAVGRQLLVEGKSLTIVGVAPRGFSGTAREPVDFWAPPGTLGRELLGEDWNISEGRYYFDLIARLTPGVTDNQADAQATAAYRSTLPPNQLDEDKTQVLGVPLNGLANPRGIGPQAKVGLWLLGVAIVVLVVACANVASLLLGRTIARGREIAVRVAIGASRGRLLRQLLTESALLSAIAAVAAIAVTYIGGRLVQQLLLPGFVWNRGVVDERVLAATLVLATLTTMAAGLAPALYALSDDVMPGLRPAPRVGRGRTGVLRSGLLVLQIALSVVLLMGAGVFLRSLAAVRAHDVGLDLDRVIEANLPSTFSREEGDRLYALALERVQTIPGVERAALGGGSTRLSTSLITTMTPEGSTGRDDRSMDAFFVVTTPYFRTLGARIERGRDFTGADDLARARVAIINRAGAERFWPGENPIGKCVSFSISFNRSTCSEIVGVVENTLLHNRVKVDNAQLFVLRSHPSAERRRLTTLVIRGADDASALVPTVRAALQTLTPDMRYVEVNSLEAMVAPQLQPWRLGSSMFFIFGAVALLIAAVGVYSTMAFAVWQRRQEIGIRMALGATPIDAALRVARSAGVTIVIGLAAGLVAAALAGPFLVDLLFETSPRDPLVMVVVAAVLAVTGLVASIVPARRAARVDPLLVLKAE
jgi:predicted permease